MKYIIDIDGTICITLNSDYYNSVPLQDRIDKINSLYDQGHEIYYWTARGSNSGQDWQEFTEQQLISWGCKYHKISIGKPAYDTWIDDKATNASTYFK